MCPIVGITGVKLLLLVAFCADGALRSADVNRALHGWIFAGPRRSILDLS